MKTTYLFTLNPGVYQFVTNTIPVVSIAFLVALYMMIKRIKSKQKFGGFLFAGLLLLAYLLLYVVYLKTR